MLLVNIDSLLSQVMQIIAKTEYPAGIELLSYKRNRSVEVIVESEQQVKVRERGYEDLEYIVPRAQLTSILKTMFKGEFPGSRKVRLHKISDPEELNNTRKIL